MENNLKTTDETSEDVVLVSACLLGHPVRYNGSGCADPALVLALAEKTVIPVCPECCAGLPTPRLPAELQGGDGDAVLAGHARVTDLSGTDVTATYVAGAQAVLALAQTHGVTEAILKQNSPSCGFGQVYDGGFHNQMVAGNGVTTALLLQHGIKVQSR